MPIIVIVVLIGCSKDDNGTQEAELPNEEFTISIKDERGNSTLRLYSNGKQFPKTASTSNLARTATVNFSQEEYDSFATVPTNKGNNTTVVFDSLNLTVRVDEIDRIVYSESDPIISQDMEALVKDVSNNLDIYSHRFEWFGNASIATFYALTLEGDTLASKSAESAFGASAKVDMTFFDENDITIVNIVGTKEEFQNVEANEVEIGSFLNYTGGTGPNGEYIFSRDGNGTLGSIGFTVSLDNIPQNNFRAIITNLQTQQKDSLETNGPQVIFEDKPIGNYTVEIKSLENDPFYSNTTQNFTLIAGDANGSQDIAVEGYDSQNITLVIRDFDSSQSLVADYEVSTNTGLTGRSDNQGQITFENVPTNTALEFIGSKNGYYTKTSGDYVTPSGEFDLRYIRRSQVDTVLNTLAIPKFTYNDGQPVEAEIIMWYRPLRDNTEAIWNTLTIYFPEANEREIAIEHLINAANLLGLNLGVNPDLEQFKGQPSASQIQGYNPYPGGERFVGEIETNVTSYGGGATLTAGKLLPNGREITFYTLGLNLGGTDESNNHHEFGNILNFPLVNATPNFQTSRDEDAADNIVINESKWDLAIMPFWIEQQRYHYTRTDEAGRLLEFSIPKRIDE